MEDEKILIYKDIVLKNSDLDLLRGPCYLNDEIIAFYFQYLTSEFDCDDILLVPPSLSFWLTNVESPESAKENIKPMRLFEKKIILFPVNNCFDPETGDDGTHWSTLVYFRRTNMFVHHDSMQGVNNENATKLYDVVKGFVSSSNSSSKGKPVEKEFATCEKCDDVTEVPRFVEYEETPQQCNGYDCGMYVLAIAKMLCEWHAVGSRGKSVDWFPAMKKHVNVSSVEMCMRSEVLKVVEDLRQK